MLKLEILIDVNADTAGKKKQSFFRILLNFIVVADSAVCSEYNKIN